MERDARLRGLLSDHQLALKVGRRLLDAATDPEDAMEREWAELSRLFGRVEEHFRLEEEVLLPALEALGDEALVHRVWDEHETLRALMAEPRRPLGVHLERLGLKLVAHIHFEESEVFRAAEQRLPREVLDELSRRALPPVVLDA